MFSESKKELVLKGFVETVQSSKLTGPNANLIELTDKRLNESRFFGVPAILSFKFRKEFINDLPFEKNDDVEILIRVKNGRKG